jgi:AbrB family looped-hinge helix DNA binding protein
MDKYKYIATISSKYQITIPRSIREKLNNKPGQKVAFIPCNGTLHMVIVPSIEKARGMLHGMNINGIREEIDEER